MRDNSCLFKDEIAKCFSFQTPTRNWKGSSVNKPFFLIMLAFVRLFQNYHAPYFFRLKVRCFSA